MGVIIRKCFQKIVKNIERKVIRHINDNFSDFSYSDQSVDSG